MKLLTLNTHSMVETGYKRKLEMFVDYICDTMPDIIALQEVNQTCSEETIEVRKHSNFKACIKSDNHAYCIVSMLKNRGINYDWCYLPVKTGYDKYDEGLAVLSRYTITYAKQIVLSKDDDYYNWRTRKALAVFTDNNRAGCICNVHMGWWDDAEEPFEQQWKKLRQHLPAGGVWLMGDFNCDDTKQGQGYDLIKSDGWYDVYRMANTDEGYTVPGKIDGWKSNAPRRIDYIWHNRKPIVEQCHVCLDECPVSDHYGVTAIVCTDNCFERSAGILMPVFSLPSENGIGCFDKCAFDFVDFLIRSGQRYWQVLPLSPTGYGDSPYQSFSSFAGNSYFISLQKLAGEGLIDKNQLGKYDFGNDKSKVDYTKIYKYRTDVLKMAFANFAGDDGYTHFCNDNSWWLDDYSVFMALKDKHDGKPWYQWEDKYKYREPYALELCRRELETDIEFHKFVQYEFYIQWHKLKSYANMHGVEIIGDIPIYVAHDSADCWSEPALFQMNSMLEPVSVAGCPPDGFSERGQLWGNPLYAWEYHKNTGYKWWLQRLHHASVMYDVVRIDHFRGFDQYYAIPYGMKDATCGRWENGPGYSLFEMVNKSDVNCKIIAEDLGFVTDSVKTLLERCGYPGMKIIQFGFDTRDVTGNEHTPHCCKQHSVMYTGTHDNHTLKGWYDTLTKEQKDVTKRYFTTDCDEKMLHNIVCGALSSVCDLCIIPVSDWLGLGDEARINTPSTSQGNWAWRLEDMSVLCNMADDIYKTTKLYGR